MNFCPLCFKMLLIETSEQKNRLICKLCRYYFPLTSEQTTTITFAHDQKLQVIEQGADKAQLVITKARCEKCGSEKAYYEERQTRSADQAATIFYTCVGCGYKWNQS